MDAPKTLILDIETSPNVAHVWGLFRQTVSLAQLRESSFTLCWSAKWHGSKKTAFKNYNDPTMVEDIWEMLHDADVVVTYNGNKFDLPVLNREFLLAGLPPPSPYHSIDLYRVVKKKFNFPSYKLKYVAQALGLTQKVEHEGHELWVGCMAGDTKAWRQMRRYNTGDVITTEELYDRLQPWIDNLPNRNLFVDLDAPVCPACGSESLQRRGYSYTRLGKYQRFVCLGCARWSRGSRRLDGAEVQVALG